MGYNCTAFTDFLGHLEPDGNYTGYIGQLQRGTADYGMILNQMPYPGDPFDYSTVYSAEKIAFATLYKRPQRPQGRTDLMASILDIDFPSIGVFFALLVLYVAVLKTQQHGKTFFPHNSSFFPICRLTCTYPWFKVSGLDHDCTFLYGQLILLKRHPHGFGSPGAPQGTPPFSRHSRAEVDLFVSRTYPVRDILRNCKNQQVRAIADKIDRTDLEPNLSRGRFRDLQGLHRQTQEPTLRSPEFPEHVEEHSSYNLLHNESENSEDQEKQSLWIPDDSPFEFLTTTAYSKTLDKGIKQVLDLAMLRGFEHQLYTDILRSRVASKMKEILLPGVEADPLCYSDTILVEEASESDDITLNNVHGIMFVSSFIYLLAFLELLLSLANK
ncbi:hypothetical protein HDE_04126 [Halotydeus destructor]|nr:hypothetical protein HDE_04126 [Halotydeus destructor]